ncbi:MAG: nitroreductase family deazaflavin-dependent oxidoreductase [bacterium]|nr:nitroreductase family deazaflavin-dependent oxidoreductase [bacterium]
MKTVLTVLGVAVLVLATFFAVIGLASEMGGEVVTLRTVQADGNAADTRLWIVEDQGALWLRAGQPNSGWYARLRAHPQVWLTRDGVTHRFRAVGVEDPAMRDRIHELMTKKYPVAEALIKLIRDGDASIPVRLDPIS